MSWDYMNGNYIAGFFDGEGSLQVRIRKDERYKSGFQILMRAEITQKNKEILEILQNHLKMGNIYFNSHDKLWQYHIYKIRDLEKLIKVVLPKSIVKKDQLQRFSECIKIVVNRQHVTQEGVNKIKNLWFVRESEANTP